MTSPDGASPGGSIMSLASFANQTEDSVQAPVNDAIASIFTFDQLFGGIGSAIGNLLGGSFSPDGPGTVAAIEHLSAKTQALIEDIDLLNGVPAYGAAYQTWNINMPGTGSYLLLPFNGPIGPRKRVDIIGSVGAKTTGGLVGYDSGLWELSVLANIDSGSIGSPESGIKPQIIVYKDGSELMRYEPLVRNSGNGADNFSLTTTYPFVIPNDIDLFAVSIFAQSNNFGKFLGGTRYSGMWLRRISEDVANTNPAADVPDAGDQQRDLRGA